MNRKITIFGILSLVLITGICLAQNYVRSIDFVEKYQWVNLGTITSAQAALSGTERTNTSVLALAAAKKVLFSPENGSVAYEFRFRTDGSENDAPVIQMYYAAVPDHYRRQATLTLAQGTQLYSGSIYFCDTITITNECYIDATLHGEPATPDNHFSSYGCNAHGHDFLFIASTLGVTTIYVDGRRI